MTENVDRKVVADFGAEWDHYDQSTLDEKELREFFDAYFAIFPWSEIDPAAIGMDVGCGSGRWAKLVATRVGWLHCIDASELALNVARRNLRGVANCEFHLATADVVPLPDGSLDFGYSLGVLHHVPDTARALAASVRKLRTGAPFLLYLYYAFDDRPTWFKAVWRVSDLARRTISKLPFVIKTAVTELIAAVVYWPFARLAKALSNAGMDVTNIPLAGYRHASYYTMRTDALDRFGTRLERRFTREQIQALMEGAGLRDVTFSESPPFWCAVGRRT